MEDLIHKVEHLYFYKIISLENIFLSFSYVIYTNYVFICITKNDDIHKEKICIIHIYVCSAFLNYFIVEVREDHICVIPIVNNIYLVYR